MKKALVGLFGLAILGGLLWFLSGGETTIQGVDPLVPAGPDSTAGTVTSLRAETSNPEDTIARSEDPERSAVAAPHAASQDEAPVEKPRTGTLRVLARWDHGGPAPDVVVVVRSNSGRTSYPVERTPGVLSPEWYLGPV